MSQAVNLSLFNLTDEMQALEKMLAADGGEITTEYEELQSQIIEMIQNKTDACVGYIQSLTDDIALAKQKKKLLDDFVKVRENTINRFESYVLNCLDQIEAKKIQGKIGEISERKAVKKAVIEEENKIPAQYTTVETVVTIDKRKILSDLKAGVAVNGARLVDGKRSLMFKFKSVG